MLSEKNKKNKCKTVDIMNSIQKIIDKYCLKYILNSLFYSKFVCAMHIHAFDTWVPLYKWP